MERRVTHQQIADHLGIARVTVTHALHRTRHSTVSQELRSAILRASHELGYRPLNLTTHAIGFVVQMDKTMLAGENRFMTLTDHALRAADYRLMLASVRDEDLTPLRNILTPKTVDGVVFTRWFNGKVKHLLPPEIPWVLTSDEDGVDADVDLVTTDTLQAMENLTNHLLKLGHRRICLVTGAAHNGFHERQKAGIRTAMRQADIPLSNMTVIEVRYDRELAQPLLEHLKSPNRATAYIGASPEKTVALINLLYWAGYRVPDDMSVVSYSDSHLLEPMHPPVTSTTALGQEVATAAVKRLMEKNADLDSSPQQTLIPAHVIERASTAPPRR